ncbi:MAG TPA: YsnF/AvaK domain-containing protein [Microlunatus sp.]
MTITTDQIQGLTGKVYGHNSDKIGSIGQIYVDDSSGTPNWVTVKTGLFGSAETFVPLDGARADGDDLYVAFAEDKINDAPRVDPDGSITPAEEEKLYAYYGLSDSDTDSYATDHDGTDRDDTATGQPAPVAGQDNQTIGRDRRAEGDDNTMTRSEERVSVGTASRETGRARLRKYVTTDTVTETVPVRHEEVTLDRQPITDTDGVAGDGQISEEEHEIVLHEEVPVVDKDVIAVEQVKLGKETVTEDVTVSEDVRKEQIERVDNDNDHDGTARR